MAAESLRAYKRKIDFSTLYESDSERHPFENLSDDNPDYDCSGSESVSDSTEPEEVSF